MNIVDIIGIVIFCVILFLSLIAVFDILFLTPRARKRNERHDWKRYFAHIKSRVSGNKADNGAPRRSQSPRHHRG
jgi:hypothetical protein